MNSYFVKLESCRVDDKESNEIHFRIKTIIFNVNRNTEKMINDSYIEIFPDKNSEIGRVLIDTRNEYSNVDFINFISI